MPQTRLLSEGNKNNYLIHAVVVEVGWIKPSPTLKTGLNMIVEKEMSNVQLREAARRQDLVKRLTIKLIEDNQMPNWLRWSYRVIIVTTRFSMGAFACYLI